MAAARVGPFSNTRGRGRSSGAFEKSLRSASTERARRARAFSRARPNALARPHRSNGHRRGRRSPRYDAQDGRQEYFQIAMDSIDVRIKTLKVTSLLPPERHVRLRSSLQQSIQLPARNNGILEGTSMDVVHGSFLTPLSLSLSLFHHKKPQAFGKVTRKTEPRKGGERGRWKEGCTNENIASGRRKECSEGRIRSPSVLVCKFSTWGRTVNERPSLPLRCHD